MRPRNAFTHATQLLRAGRWLDAALALQKRWLRAALPAATGPAAIRPSAAREDPPDFPARSFGFGGFRWRYRVFEPAGRPPGQPLPLLVMLHGCRQDSLDFAQGTGMNGVAQREGLLVLYPEQRRKSNRAGCWNWFDPSHQGPAAGEPAMLAALVRHVAARWHADASRMYVAGLSAGGAMATLLAEAYPGLFAAVGVHSGLPPRAAHDLRSAFAAMRRGAGTPGRPAPAVPTIVFHGDADDTVARSNAEAILHAQVAAHQAGTGPLRQVQTHERDAAAPRAADRTRWIDATGRPLVEHWSVRTGPHAWSGGHPTGSFTDPHGPSASEAMVRFFLEHPARQVSRRPE